MLLSLCLVALASSTAVDAMPPEWNLPSMPAAWSLNAGAAHRCVPIPETLELCSDIGYKEMRLPNMLNHDTVSEVEDQTRPWIPLAKLSCHREVRVLLCSIYAPVCIAQLPDRQIKPCRSLCEAVMRPCSVMMSNFGFSWPEILNCTQFPPDSDLMCIKSSVELSSKSSGSAECHACPERVTYESIIGNYCVNKVVFKARIDRVISESSGRTRLQLKRKVRYFKATGLTGQQKRELRTVTLDTGSCKCRALEAFKSLSSTRYIMMGSVSPDGTGFTVSHLVEWQRRQPAFSRAMRQIRGGVGGGGRKRGRKAAPGTPAPGASIDAAESSSSPDFCKVSRHLREPPPPPKSPGNGRGVGGRSKRKQKNGGGGGGGGRNRNKKKKKKDRKNGGNRKKSGGDGGGGGGGGGAGQGSPRDAEGRYTYGDAYYYANYHQS